ncbi:hypothetical protein L1987_86277 [Smallanthus sonchifolius]|uniref:Uncharacterized protein n=1 Tax=Smallanthus sonchifolius TaxID=185202 RepID=A0ACB8XYU6_9ASTR|nr:hypothetical protein L1987_86277 [Smallanthus sonchifolius]
MVTRSITSLRKTIGSMIEDKNIVALFVDLFGTDAFDVAVEFGVPRYLFFPASAMTLSLFLHLPELDRTVPCESNDAYKRVLHNAKRYVMAKGIVVNSFKELEGGPIEVLQQDRPGKPPVYPVGPLITGSVELIALRAKSNENGIVDRLEIVWVVTGLLQGEEGKGIRVQAQELKEASASVLSEDVTTYIDKMGVTGVYKYLVVVVLIAAVSSTVVTSCPPSDREALLAFKSGLTEPYLGIFKTWTGTDCCTNWYGISCDPTDGRVNDIILRGESEDKIFEKAGRSGYMTGSLSPSICSLDRLTTLIVADWKGISGEIPACITSLPHLRILDLIGNQISGKIPADIGKLEKLTVLNVADNKIAGEIPSSIVNLRSLMHLDLSNNQISGVLPTDLGKLTMMSRALLNRNQISGAIPSSISGIYRLADLDLSMNRISGSIPAQIGSMPVLSTLNLDSNQITGEIPASLLSNSGLNIVNLSRNALDGYLPDVFTPRTYFSVLDLSFNKLKGAIPKSLSSAKYIGHLDLSNNHLCGSIPVGFPFDHLEASSFTNNDCLCGSPLMRVC